MAARSPLQWTGCGAAAIALIWLALFGKGLAGPSESDPANPVIRHSAFPVVLVWPWGALLAFIPKCFPAESVRGIARPTRWAYSIGCILCLLHVAVAFHLGHGWSARAAYEHTERVSGYGWGVYVNYLFVAIWIADAAWAWIALEPYLHRPIGLSLLIAGSMAFLMINATIVFGHGAMRWASLIALT